MRLLSTFLMSLLVVDAALAVTQTISFSGFEISETERRAIASEAEAAHLWASEFFELGRLNKKISFDFHFEEDRKLNFEAINVHWQTNEVSVIIKLALPRKFDGSSSTSLGLPADQNHLHRLIGQHVIRIHRELFVPRRIQKWTQKPGWFLEGVDTYLTYQYRASEVPREEELYLDTILDQKHIFPTSLSSLEGNSEGENYLIAHYIAENYGSEALIKILLYPSKNEDQFLRVITEEPITDWLRGFKKYIKSKKA